MANFDDFLKLDIQVGKIIKVLKLSNPKHTTHKITIDFGPEISKKVSGARLVRYTKKQLVDKLVLGVVNLPPKQIGKFNSEVLTLGAPDNKKECVLIAPDNNLITPGSKVY